MFGRQLRCNIFSNEAVNTKGTEGEISDDLKAIIRYMDTGAASSDYTKALEAEVKSVKSGEKVRMQYMLLADVFYRERNLEIIEEL